MFEERLYEHISADNPCVSRNSLDHIQRSDGKMILLPICPTTAVIDTPRPSATTRFSFSIPGSDTISGQTWMERIEKKQNIDHGLMDTVFDMFIYDDTDG